MMLRTDNAKGTFHDFFFLLREDTCEPISHWKSGNEIMKFEKRAQNKCLKANYQKLEHSKTKKICCFENAQQLLRNFSF